MTAENLHNPDDSATFRWYIECANPIIPGDWKLTVNPYQHVTDYFTIDLTVKPEVKLPTKVGLKLCNLAQFKIVF